MPYKSVFDPDQILKFLKALDGYLSEKHEVILIGGSAASLAYRVSKATKDVDFYGRLNSYENHASR